MLSNPALFVSMVVAVAGAILFLSNPRRMVNRTLFSCSVHGAIWLLLRAFATATVEGLLWARATYSVGALIVVHLWLVKEALVSDFKSLSRQWYSRLAGWLVVSAVVAVVPWTGLFIPATSTAEAQQHGPLQIPFFVALLLLVLFLLFDSIRSMRSLTGARRLELQVWLVGGCLTAAAILIVSVLRFAMTEPDSFFNLLAPLIIFVFYVGIGFVITTGRIFDARQLMLVAIEKLALILAVSAVVGAAYLLLTRMSVERPLIQIPVATAVGLGFAVQMNRWLNRRFRFYPEATQARRAAFEVAKEVLHVERLEEAFLPVLRGWGDSEQALVLSGPREEIKGCGITLPPNSPMVDALRRIRWATPERLERERSTPEREEIGRFMEQQGLGVLLCSRGLSLTVLVGVGPPISRRPYTYPEVMQLQELAAIIESALERSHFSMKAQHAERLATVGLLGAGLAHEIRNPLVTIKTFVQLLPQRHHEAGFREKFFQLITEEITRIDRLTEQLMDMASPRSYFMVPMPLHPLVRNTLELVEPKAADRQIEISLDLRSAPDVIFSDAAAARQVLLNLCFNAIHALESIQTIRWIRIATRSLDDGIELSVTDSGPGLASEIIPRLFAPFQSTKSSGFGLGLAISGEIMSGLKGAITADPPKPGEGATFRLKFPCPPPSS